ncbi:MAG: LLM class flavin-dependent oxidoreductase [Acidimicrobiia bacterium]|nr:LLM class flavin-dependent oxidoreductase [Acidimicrobiia bacterium]
MALSIIRFDMRCPDMAPEQAAQQYAAALDMARWADQVGFDMVVLSEHHSAPDGFLPSPLVMAAAVAGCTERIPLNVAALLVPLHDPIRLAEDIAVLDLISGGRISLVAGLGYRPVEYELFDRTWSQRGKRMDECLEVLLAAWSGEPFEYRGTTVTVTPRPLQQPHPLIMIGGSGPAAAKRAARFDLGFFPPVGDESLAQLYRDECERLGRPPGLVLLPSGPGTLVCAEDPDAAWATIGPYLLHDAVTYASWQTPDIRSHVKADATTVDELRAEGVYQILTPEECVTLAGELGPFGALTHHPLCGGIPPELAWPHLELFADKVLPALADATGGGDGGT